jgi:hypothetical protein
MTLDFHLLILLDRFLDVSCSTSAWRRAVLVGRCQTARNPPSTGRIAPLT